MLTWIFSIVVLGTLVFVLTSLYYYHQIKVLDERIESSWRKLDNELLKMEELSLGLIQMLEPYIGREKKQDLEGAREKMMKARDFDVRIRASEELFMKMEPVSELKEDEGYQDLMENISDAQDRINYLKKYYNDSALFYNQVLASRPEKWIAQAFDQKKKSTIAV